MTQPSDPYLRVLKQPDEGDPANAVAVSSPPGGKDWQPGANLPFEPPLIETFRPSRTGLPPDVIAEWSGQCQLRSETDPEARELRLVRSHWSDVRWWEIPRTALVKSGFWRRKPNRVG